MASMNTSIIMHDKYTKEDNYYLFVDKKIRMSTEIQVSKTYKFSVQSVIKFKEN